MLDHRRWFLAAAFLVAAVALAGCGGETCGDACTRGLSCTAVVDASDDEELAEAVGEATRGTCIALAAGTYGEVTLPAGVSLLGADSAKTTVGTVTIPAGSGALVRGLHVAGVVKLEPDAVDVRLERLLVTGSKNGIQADARASFTVADSVLSGVPEVSVLAIDSARVTVQRTTIENGAGPGVWVQCSAGCDCATPPVVELDTVTVRRAAHGGVVLVGSSATLTGVSIVDTQAGADFQGGGGLSASECSHLAAKALTVGGSLGYGVLLDGASADLGGGGDEVGIIIVNSRGGGLYVQNTGDGQPVSIANTTLTGNSAVGLHLASETTGIIIVNSKIEKTQLASVPAEGWVGANKAPIGSADVGDGLIWGFGAAAQIDGLELSDNARNAALIDGPVGAGSSIANVTLGGTDAAKGIEQQHVSSPAEAPSTSNAPAIAQSAASPDATPVPPAGPNAI